MGGSVFDKMNEGMSDWVSINPIIVFKWNLKGEDRRGSGD